MIGVPRKKSVYAIARARSGLAPGPGRPRTIAIPSASTSTSASAITIIFRFSWNPAQTSGMASVKLWRLKKAWSTCWSACIERLVQGRDLGEVEVEPLLLELADRAVLGQRGERLVDDRQQLRALLEHGAVLLVRVDLTRNGTELRRVLLLLERDERHVEDQRLAPVDLHRLICRCSARERERFFRGMERRVDPVESRRVRLRAELQLAQVGEAL